MSPSARPSDHVRLEADLAAPPPSAWVSRPAEPEATGPVVLVAEADAALRDHVAQGLTERVEAGGRTFRVETAGTAGAVLARLAEGGVGLLLCGRLPPLPDGRTLAEALAERPPLQNGAAVLVHRGPVGALLDALPTTAGAARLGEAIARLWDRGLPPASVP